MAPAQEQQNLIEIFSDANILIELAFKRNPMNNAEHLLKAFFSNKNPAGAL